MGRIVNAAWGPVNIAAGASVYQHTVTADGTLRLQVFLDAVVGGATDYVAWVQKQRVGAGSSYPILPRTTGTGIAGWTALAFASIALDCVAGDVLDVYVDGQPGDGAVSGKIEIFRDHTLAEVAAAVWNALTVGFVTVGSIGKLIVDNLNGAVGGVCACVVNAIMGVPGVLQLLSSENLELYRGDTWNQTITGLGDLTGATEIWFTAKNDKDDLEGASIIQIKMTTGLRYINGAVVALPANGSITITLPATDGVIAVYLDEVEAAKLEGKKIYYDVQKLIGGVVTTPKRGNLFVTRDVTRDVV